MNYHQEEQVRVKSTLHHVGWIPVILMLLAFGNSYGQTEKLSYEDSLKQVFSSTLDQNLVDSAFQANSLLIRYYREEGNDYEYVRQHINRAEILRTIGGQEEALKTLQTVEELNQTLELSTVRSAFFNRKAAVLFELKRHEDALAAVRESQRIDSIKGFRWRLFSNINIVGAIYRDIGEYEKSRRVLKGAYDLAAEAQDSAEWASAAYNLTLLSSRLKDFPNAVKFGRKHIEVQLFRKNNIVYGDILYMISQAYEQLGNYDSAFFFIDSAYGTRMRHMQTIIDDNANKYKIVDELERERIETRMLKDQEDRSRLQRFILILAVMVALLLIYFANRQSKHYKRISEQEKAYNLELEKSLAFKNKLISIVAHDIRNPMASLQGLIHVYNEGLVEEKDLRQMMGGLEATVANVDLLLENLLNWVRTQSQDLKPFLEDLEVKQLVHNAIAEAEAQLKAKRIKVEQSGIEEGHSVRVDSNFMAFILRNVLSNAIKFSPQESSIEISYSQVDSFNLLEIRDYGKGINADMLEKLNNHKLVNSTKGMGKEKGTGLGVSLSRDFLQRLNGKMEIESSLGEGTLVKLYLPILELRDSNTSTD